MSEAKPRGKATYQDVLDAPEHLVAEILDGELVLSPRPAGPGHVHRQALPRGGEPRRTLAVHGGADVARAERSEDVESDLWQLWADLAAPPARASELIARYAGKQNSAAREGWAGARAAPG